MCLFVDTLLSIPGDILRIREDTAAALTIDVRLSTIGSPR
jgi:hypothetical protein